MARRDDQQQYSLWADKAAMRRLRYHAVDTDTNVAELVRRYIAEGMERDGIADDLEQDG